MFVTTHRCLCGHVLDFNVFACQKYEAKVALGYLRKNNTWDVNTVAKNVVVIVISLNSHIIFLN